MKDQLTQNIKPPANDVRYLHMGVGMIILSFLVFINLDFEWLPLEYKNNDDKFILTFFVNYGIAFIYFIGWITTNNFKWSKLFSEKLSYTLIFILLCLTSCFSLNRLIPIFRNSTIWLQAILLITSVSIVIKILNIHVPKFIQHFLFFWLGIACMLQFYYVVYLIPIYPFGLLGSFFLGMSLHTFAPLFLLIGLICLVRKELKTTNRPSLSYAFIGGITLPLICLLFIIIQYHSIRSTVKDSERTVNQGLPTWVSMSQRLPNNWVTNHFLTLDLSSHMRWFNFPTGNFSSKKVHDPLFTTASFLMDGGDINYYDRKNIVVSRLNFRHEVEDKLWNDSDLSTKNVQTTVELLPSYRMAYTEKVLDIHNSNSYKSNQQEALYTFYLPEGSVITSLSLWVNGIEEKGYLTTKQKAEEAYNTIVGRERRDPSLVTWKEGNTVTVRIFPCTPAEDRKVKIGITTPLMLRNGQLVYDNIYFKGPNFTKATEETHIITHDAEKIDYQDITLKKNKDNLYNKGNYQHNWSLQCKAPNLNNQPFSFGGKSYQLDDYIMKYSSQEFSTIYLDINATWTNQELKKTWKNVKGKKVYVYNTDWELATEKNYQDLFEKAQSFNFSLLPIYDLPTYNKALIITKASEIAPNLSDLKNSVFYAKLKSFYPTQPIALYNIGTQLSPYLKSLKELRYFHYVQGELSTLTRLLKENKFIANVENEHCIVLHNSKMKLTENVEGIYTNNNSTPDHLLRLFQYNYIMKNIGPMYFTEEIDTNLVNRAKQAYVVSPLSSLIVLETQNDYDRFGIKKTDDSLGNAGISGAVPEPHEWALIIISLLVITYLSYKRHFASYF